MQEMDLNDDVDNNGLALGIQLFTAPSKLFKNDVKPPDFTFHFTVYLTGIVDNYHVCQMDGLLSQQLWSSVADQPNDEADFKLIANDGKSFPVHKWMLAARSSVFAALFSNEEEMESVDFAIDCAVDEMKQFIKFIYTGELDELASHELMDLAANFEIKTLEDLCKSSFQDSYAFTRDKLAMMALHLECGSHLICINDASELTE